MPTQSLNFYISLGSILFIAVPLIASLCYFLLKNIEVPSDSKLGHSFILHEKTRKWWVWIISPIEKFCLNYNIEPSFLTLLGLAFSIVAGFFYHKGLMSLAGLFLILCGICDILDGRIARKKNLISPKGAFLDSVVDRIGEIFIFGGLLSFFRVTSLFWVILAILGGAFITSYVKARAEGLGISGEGGIMQRPERIALLAIISPISSLFGQLFDFTELTLLIVILDLMAILTIFTALQRIFKTVNRF